MSKLCNWIESFEKLKFSLFLSTKIKQTLSLVLKLKYFFEEQGFHIASRLAERLGMRTNSVRLFFIYISFVTAGLWFGVYLTVGFLLKLKDLVRAKRSSVFDL